ncbi:MAG: hypothetical protein JSV64_02955 [Candidatus Bathyarchaeota archaeon]|nr:MAG: hypothetical protein JSV64_02955 [Candidatus Bathyarchaeota archaeon]
MIRKAVLGMMLTLLLVSMSFALTIKLVKTEPTTIIVPDDYEKIQWAIGNASAGDTVFIEAGTYYELVVVNKTISLKGESRDSTIIDGGGSGTVVSVTSNFAEVSELTIQNCGRGITTRVGPGGRNSYGASLQKLRIRNSSGRGIDLAGSNHIISDCILEFNRLSIYVDGVSNTIKGSTILNTTAGQYALYFEGGDNRIYHNNFYPPFPIAGFGYINKWDNGAEGNYWAGYSGEDLDGDGIGDTLTPHRGVDSYPLIDPWTRLRRFEVKLDGTTHSITTFSESTIASFHLDLPEKALHFNITSAETGFCNITVPIAIFNNTFKVSIDGVRSSFVSQQNATHSFVWFEHALGSHSVQVKSILVISSNLSISIGASALYIGFKVEIDGRLTLVNGTGISNAQILLFYSTTAGDSWADITSATTGLSGNFSVQWIPSATGVYNVRAIYVGNETNSIHILETITTTNLAVLPFEEQNVFSVTSNSTVSELAFNSTSRELGFTVTGPSGATGYVNVHIARTLVENIADVEVYLDGDQTNYTTTLLADSWLLHLTYLHSTHKITINLGQIFTPFNETAFGKVLIYGVPITAMIVLSLFLLRKPMHKFLESRKTLNSETEKPKA